jgi:hypothetical protein
MALLVWNGGASVDMGSPYFCSLRAIRNSRAQLTDRRSHDCCFA